MLDFETKIPTPPSKETKEMLNLNVLVADDEEMIRRMISMVLRTMGCTIEEVANGKELVERLDKAKPGEFSLIITDNNMPVMNGIDALKNIRTDDRFKELPTVFISGKPDDKLKKNVSDLGGVFLEKPFSIDKLTEAIEKATSLTVAK
ncbi:MAG: response regulator [Candidatus Paceibacterota bacterium]|jgi:two-component system chemotaxis response regulator CheY